MTKWQRIRNVLGGIAGIVCAVLTAILPPLGRIIIIEVIGVSAVLKGIGRFTYYFSLTRFMVGGKIILYEAVLLLDFGLFTVGVANIPQQYIMAYLLLGYLFYGGIGVMRALEIRKNGGSWRFRMLTAAGSIVLGVLCLTEIGSEAGMVYIYCAGMVWSAVGRIVSAFRPSAVLYVQQA